MHHHSKTQKTIPYEELVVLTKRALKNAGLQKNHATVAAEAICVASLRGVDSHGIRLLPHYLKAIKAGRIDAGAKFTFQRTTPSTGMLNANHGMAHAATGEAMDHAIALAKDAGTGFVSVKNSNHCGAMAYYALRACEHDMIGFAFTNATAKLQTHNSATTFFGINPTCIAAPMEGEEPFCYDAAPSIMSNNKVKMYKERGENLPPDVAADEKGNMTLDPTFAKMLIPLGGQIAGYKGFGMAMVGDILCSLLSGMPNGKDVSTMYESDGGNIADKRYLGQFVGAMRIDAFEDPAVFRKRLKETADKIRTLPQQHGDALVMVPGDPEKRTQADRLQSGIFVSQEIYEIIMIHTYV